MSFASCKCATFTVGIRRSDSTVRYESETCVFGDFGDFGSFGRIMRFHLVKSVSNMFDLSPPTTFARLRSVMAEAPKTSVSEEEPQMVSDRSETRHTTSCHGKDLEYGVS